MDTKKENGQPSSIKFRDESIFEVLTHFSMMIEDCDLKEVGIRIKRIKRKEDGKV
tara:strand:+ start:187 stop:351 length:165 start_codon:yes stop_codon:yes gene_type:complete